MQSLFNNYVAKNIDLFDTSAFELKFIDLRKRKSLPFSEVKDHQIRGLQLAEKALVYKIPDSYAGGKKPFDSFIIKKAKSFVVTMFYSPRKPKEFILIPVKRFIDFRDNSKRKSLTEEIAKQIGKQYLV